jgi:glucose/arabinose dehydrogenase/N-acetylneuraminic acid mutarotase
MAAIIYQAEDALLSGVAVVAGNGAEGTGYADYQNATGDFIEWTVDAPNAGNYELSWRYANGQSNRPLSFSINGATIDSSLDFVGTGSWSTWGFVTQTVALQAGTNKIRLAAIGSSGANFDYLTVKETTTAVPVDVIISDAVATEGTNSYLVFDVSLSSASTKAITLNLGTTDISAKGGLISSFPDTTANPIDYANQEFEVSNDGGITWQAAINGTEVTFAAGQTNLKVRLAINDDTAAEGINAETMSLGVESILSGTVNDFSDQGTGSIVDNDEIVFDVVYQAENALLSGPLVFTGNGAEGGYADYQNATGDFIEWTIDAPNAGNYELSWRYANRDSNRPLSFSVNGVIVDSSLDFVGTGSTKTWGFVTQTVALQAGTNKIRLTAIGSSGANFDYLRAKEVTTPVFDAVYQAENALLSGPLVFTGNGAEGGYADYQNPTGDFIEWTIDAPNAGNYELSWRYAHRDSNRPLSFTVNGATIDSSLDFAGTGSTSTWGFVTQTLALQAGINKIRLTAIGSSGANFDYLRVKETTTAVPINVSISDAIATEGTNNYLIFDVSLSSTSIEDITLDLAATDISAKGGLTSNFSLDIEGDPIDYANQEFEVSNDGGITWQAAINGTEVTFAAGQINLKVRLAVHNDVAIEDINAETMSLGVESILSGTVNDFSDKGIGSILDDDGEDGAAGTPISTLPFTQVRVEGNLTLDFDGLDGGLTDQDGEGIGFTMVDPASNPGNPNPLLGVVGYWPEKLNVVNGDLLIETTSGLQNLSNNSLDNALGVGLNVPSKLVKLETTLKNLPTPVGGSAQAGLWFGKAESGGDGSSEDNYIKLVVRSDKSGNYLLEAFMEKDGLQVGAKTVDIPENATIGLSLFIDPTGEKVIAQYSINGGNAQTLTTFSNVPTEWFSFDQAGINPEIATRSFGGIFASHRNASSPQIFTFDNFSVTEDELPPPTTPASPSPTGFGNISFDSWSIPVNNATDLAFGPDGKLYVATLFGNIHEIAFNPVTKTVISNKIISTIRTSEGGNRLTLGLDVDPDSTPDNVVLWVAHSDGSIDNGGLNSGKISRLSGPGFTQKQDVITGLPRAIANHATNNIEFGPDGKLYVYQGGNTGAGSANLAASEFGTRPEQPLSAALLVVDIPHWKADPTGFNGNVASPIGEFIDQFYARKQQELGRPFTEVQVYASGLRNTYDGVFHSNGNIYAPDNGLGVTGTVPPVPRLGSPTDRNVTTLLGQDPIDNPGPQPDPLNLIVQGGYYGHPNPYRDEVVFQDGSFQKLPADPDYKGHLDILGSKLSANGIIEYTANNFFGQLQGDLLITNYSSGDNITRVKLSANGTSVVQKSSLIGGFKDPLPIEMGPNGTIFVGEFNGGKITVLQPLGVWRSDLPVVPQSILDAGSAVLNEKLYMVGGKTATNHVNSMYIYNPGNPFISTDDTWTVGANLPGVAVENPSLVALNGQLYAFGGSTAPFSGAVNNAAIYNPTNNLWTSIAPMPTARGGATAQVLNGDIYVIGGLDASGASVNLVEIYDPETNTWRTGSSLQTRRDNPGSAVIGDSLYVFGGRTRNADGTVENGTLSSMEIFKLNSSDPLIGSWSSGPSMPTGRRTMAVGIMDNKIQVIGGEGSNVVFNQNEEFNPLTNTWKSLPSITTARHGAAFGTIGDVIYVAGGGNLPGSSFTNVVQAFDA